MRKSWLDNIKAKLWGYASGGRDDRVISTGQVALLIIGGIVLLIISACSPDEDNNMNASFADTNASPAADIEDHIRNSYARLAATRSDVCPKLLQQDVDSSDIKRSAEVMVGNHCDYFLYPQEGERITVTLDNSDIEALLIVPTIYDFANGSYVVDSYDKHVIRLSYNGIEYKPKQLRYDVTVRVTATDDGT